ncbi:nucleotidyltransferase family protein [Phyllobacterium leguminum]|uniref:MurNAc alpha-1-phosphate uridylyltransferase n=1 Tax=Phyllobacterium leguminum TaxID=314237 RepID=A0A318T3A1_9HYPH|nr:nucleotidyltransferase family protein [Phyllobacterium leguminum]PYE89096.1 MurNAc alpha-1-phosphate uridylyltransferase [Phyllobacterium leguminum]
MTAGIPQTAMVLAAGLGKRMRPITDTIPKPLVSVSGKPLIDWGLDALAEAGVDTAVVNVHYLADKMEIHLAGRTTPRIVISDEREELLDSAGGVVKALSHLGSEAFYILNADTFWIEGGTPNLRHMASRWDAGRMDILLMLAAPQQATGHTGRGDFLMDGEGRLIRFSDNAGSPLIYAGAAIVHPRIFAGASGAPESLNRYFDRAIAEDRLYGMKMDGLWLTVGTPDAIGEAEAALAARV